MMDIDKVLEAIAPPQDCATCEHLNLDQTMPLTDPPIPIADCPIACGDEDDAVSMAAAIYWAHKSDSCPAYRREMTKDELRAKILELEGTIEDLELELEYADEVDHDYGMTRGE